MRHQDCGTPQLSKQKPYLYLMFLRITVHVAPVKNNRFATLKPSRPKFADLCFNCRVLCFCSVPFIVVNNIRLIVVSALLALSVLMFTMLTMSTGTCGYLC